MAAYAASMTLSQPKARPLTPGIGYMFGTMDVTNYNSTLAEIVDGNGNGLNDFFRSAPKVFLSSCSDLGYTGIWDATGKTVKCWDQLDAAPGELANDVDAGSFDFIAIGPI